MSWGLENGERVGTELDGRLVADVVHRWLWRYARRVEVEGVHIDTQLLILLLIGHAAFDVELIVTMDKSATHDVIEMEVGTEHVNKLELFALHVVLDCSPFCLGHASWVDDAGFFRIIADDITVFHQRIYLKSLDIHNEAKG